MIKTDTSNQQAYASSAIDFSAQYLYSKAERKQAQKNLETQIRYNQQAANIEWNRNREAWRAENEYNLPAEQMDRLKAAGINPHMAYAKGTINNVASGAPKYSSSRLDNVQVPHQKIPTGTIQNYQDTAMRSAQLDNVKQATANARTTNAINVLRQAGLNEDNKAKIRNNIVNDEYRAEGARLINDLRTRQGSLISLKANYQTELNRMARLNLSPSSNGWIAAFDRVLQAYKLLTGKDDKNYPKLSGTDEELWEQMKKNQNR